ncbi:MAG: hypothetical protein ACUVS9_01240 [Thermaceae bacterium]
MKGVDNLWITLWITRGVPVDNPVDNLWITPPFSTPVDNWGGFPQVIHRGTPLIHRSYPQAVSAPGRYFPPFIHISTGPTTTTTMFLILLKRKTVVVIEDAGGKNGNQTN